MIELTREELVDELKDNIGALEDGKVEDAIWGLIRLTRQIDETKKENVNV